MIDVPGDQQWTLETDRLLLEPMTVSDARELHVLRTLDSDAPADDGFDVSLQRVRARIRRWERRRSPDGAEVWLNWTLRLKDDQSVIGRMQATVTECQADIAWVIGRRFRNQGYATEAARCIAAWLLEFFNVDEVRATIHPNNSASQRVAAKVGMRRNGERTSDGEDVWSYAPCASPDDGANYPTKLFDAIVLGGDFAPSRVPRATREQSLGNRRARPRSSSPRPPRAPSPTGPRAC